MEQLISRTKILPPQLRSDLLSRARLLDTLTDLLDYSLILLVAPPGYGKTYALFDLCQALEWKSGWYTITSVDNDITRFVAHFIAALREQFPAFGEESSIALRNYKPGQGEIEQLVIPIVNELYTTVGEHFVIVIDDYHIVGDNQEIGSFVSRFVQHVDDSCHIILSSRTLPGLPDMPLLVARGLVAGLDYEDLAFRSDELQTLVLQNYGISLSASEADGLVRSTEGWITGMLLSAQTQQWDAARRLRTLRGTGVGLYDYLAQQVLDQQDADLRLFLLRTSVMGEFDGELCDQVLLPEWLPAGLTWNDYIDELEEKNLFVSRVGAGTLALRYHNLFQEFLRDVLVRKLPEERPGILMRLTDAYLSRQEWELAYEAAEQLGDLEALASVVEKAGLPMVRAGRFLQIEHWLSRLPPGFVTARPELDVVRAYSQVQMGQVVEGLDRLTSCIYRLEEVDEIAPSLSRALVYRSIANKVLGNYQEALEDSRRALTLIQSSGSSPQPGDMPSMEHDRGGSFQESGEKLAIRALAMSSHGMILQKLGEAQPADEFLRKAVADFEQLGDAQNTAVTLYEIGIANADAGHQRQALQMFQRALSIWKSSHNVMGQALVLNSIGVSWHDQGQYVRSFEALVEALACARRSGYTRLEAFSLASLGDVYADLEMWQAAQDVYQQAYRIAKEVNEWFLILHLELARAFVSWSAGEWGIAYNCLDAAAQLVLDRDSSYEWGLYRLAMGRYYLAQRNAAAAVEPLEDAVWCFKDAGHTADAVESAIYLVAANASIGRSSEAATYLEYAVGILSDIDMPHSLIVAARSVHSDLPAWDEFHDPGGNYRRLLQKIDEFEEQMPVSVRTLRRRTIEALPATNVGVPSIVVHALGRTEVLVAGVEVPISKWKTKVSRDLFLCFLAYPEGLTKEQVGLMFWPDCSSNQLKTRFKNSIYRLRTALDRDVILFEDAVYFLDPSIDYEYDVRQFLECLAEAKEAEDPMQQVKHLKSALALYGGEYLPDVDAEWAAIERENLRSQYLESALDLAQLYFQNDALEDSLTVCRRLLSEDPCLEEAHRLAMRVHAANGNRVALARQYAQCRQALQEEIGVSPSPQTEELFALLMR